MLSFLDGMLGVFGVTVYREGKRFLKIKSLSLKLRALKAARRAAYVMLGFYLNLLILSGSIFVIISHSLYQWQSTEAIFFDAVLLTASSLALISASIALFALREKLWLRTFGVNKDLETLLPRKVFSKSESQPPFDEAALIEHINRTVENKINEIFDRRLDREETKRAEVTH